MAALALLVSSACRPADAQGTVDISGLKGKISVRFHVEKSR